MSGEHYIDAGMKMARQIFAKRGNHSEIHLSEAELATLLALAFKMGYDHPTLSTEHTGASHG